jgi:hypothetical protein
MKNILGLIVLSIGISAFAGPEDHVQAQTCYGIRADQVALASSYVPQQICIENLTLDTSNDTISAYSYFMNDLFKDLKIVTLTRKNEDFYSFSAKNILAADAQITTDKSVHVEMTISGLSDVYGQGDINYLKISVQQRTDAYGDLNYQTDIFDYEKQ